MTFSLTLGWWLLPASVTLLSIGYVVWGEYQRKRKNPYTNDAYGAGAVISAIFLAIAIIISLVAWLVWSLFK